MVRLNRTYYSLLNFTSKLFQNWVFRAKFKQIKQNPLNSPIYSANYAKFAPIINLFILCFRGLPRQRTLRNSSELRRFRAVRPHSPRTMRNSPNLLTYSTLCFRPAPAENAQEFQRITQIPCNSPTKSANYVKFAPFVNISYVSDTCPGREPSEFQRIMQIPRSSPTQSANHVKFAPFANIIHYVSDA